MINLQNLKDVLMFKESTTEAQNVFMEEFNIYTRKLIRKSVFS